MNGFSTLNEKSLHASLKEWYRRPGDRLEEPLDGFFIDILRGDHCVEIQTGNFSAIRRKLWQLLEQHPVRLVYPIAIEKQIVRLDSDGVTQLSRRRSPRRGTLLDLFNQLIYAPSLLQHDNFTLEILLIREEELRQHQPGKHWRRQGWGVVEHRLLEVVESRVFQQPVELLELLPPGLPGTFTTADLAAGLKRPRALTQKLAYCLRSLDLIRLTGKSGNALLYELV
ncbi:MAG: hypothetical protein ISR91_06645 [Candidatus Delongbacteria bacterium]|nr:hypothetical protein [bacterium]MBL7033807.1 hypothetical protein [Candidatus Delongbacteria bacterium]